MADRLRRTPDDAFRRRGGPGRHHAACSAATWTRSSPARRRPCWRRSPRTAGSAGPARPSARRGPARRARRNCRAPNADVLRARLVLLIGLLPLAAQSSDLRSAREADCPAPNADVLRPLVCWSCCSGCCRWRRRPRPTGCRPPSRARPIPPRCAGSPASARSTSASGAAWTPRPAAPGRRRRSSSGARSRSTRPSPRARPRATTWPWRWPAPAGGPRRWTSSTRRCGAIPASPRRPPT